MSISSTVKNQLWARSRNRCAICDRILVEFSGDAHHTVGELCHIVAKDNGGPRANPNMSEEEKDSFDNIIVLCPNHHTLIDKDTITYSVDRLKMIKKEHEEKNVCEKMEVYNFYINEFDRLCSYANWSRFTGNFLYSSRYVISKLDYDTVLGFIDFVRTRPNPLWEIETIDGAFYSFAKYLHHFISIFNSHRGDSSEQYYFEKFYHHYEYPKSDEVFKEFDAKTTDLCNLLAEMTRCINLIIKRISNEIIPNFAMLHGYVYLDNSGITLSGGHGEQAQLHYSDDIASKVMPYEGLDNFLNEVKNHNRDYYFERQEN